MGRRIRYFTITIILFLVFLLGGCSNALLEDLVVDVARALNTVLTINTDGNGTVSPSGEITVITGTVVNISATPNTGYVFLSWTGTGINFGNRYSATTTVSLTGKSATIIANFADALDVKNLTINSDVNGTTNPSGSIPAMPGDPIDITATPDYSYEFTDWSIEGGAPPPVFGDSGSASTTVTVTANSSIIQANFSLIEYILTVTNDGNGTTTPGTPQTVIFGNATAITATVTPAIAMRYFFKNWTVPAGSASIGNTGNTSTTATLTSGDATVHANFDKYSIYYGDWSSGITRNSMDWAISQNLPAAAGNINGMDLDIPNEHIYYTVPGSIRRSDLDGSNDISLVNEGGAPHGIALDLVNSKIYWTNWQFGQVKRSNLNGSNVELLIIAGQPRGIDIDIVNQKVYVCDLSMRVIYEHDLAGAPNNMSFVVPGGLSQPYHLKIDQVNRKLYCSDFAMGLIHVYDMDAGFTEVNQIGGLAGPNAVDVDPANGIIAIVETYASAIRITDLNGSMLGMYPTTGSYGYAVALDQLP